MTNDELFGLAEKAGLGFVKHADPKDVAKFQRFAKLVAQHEHEAILAVIGDNQCECRCSEVVRDRGKV